jgi:phosphatidylglycerophosphate synthase
MDHWDGEIARHRGTASFVGMCFDNAASAIIYSALFIAVGQSSGETTWAAMAIVGTVLMRPVYALCADDHEIKSAAWKRFGQVTPFFLDEGGPPPYYLVAVFFVFDSMAEWVMVCAIGYAAFTAWLCLEKYAARSFDKPV